jgi:hypothetical protein
VGRLLKEPCILHLPAFWPLTNTNDKIIIPIIANPKGVPVSFLLGIAPSLRCSQGHFFYFVCIKLEVSQFREQKIIALPKGTGYTTDSKMTGDSGIKFYDFQGSFSSPFETIFYPEGYGYAGRYPGYGSQGF